MRTLWENIKKTAPLFNNFSSSSSHFSSSSRPHFISNPERWRWALQPPLVVSDDDRGRQTKKTEREQQKEEQEERNFNDDYAYDWNLNPQHQHQHQHHYHASPSSSSSSSSDYLAQEYERLATPKGKCDFPKVAIRKGHQQPQQRQRKQKQKQKPQQSQSSSGHHQHQEDSEEHQHRHQHHEHPSGDDDVEDVYYLDSAQDFMDQYMRRPPKEQVPVVLVNATDIRPFTRLTTRPLLLYCFGDFPVKLSSANKNSYDKKIVDFKDYVLGINDDHDHDNNEAHQGHLLSEDSEGGTTETTTALGNSSSSTASSSPKTTTTHAEKKTKTTQSTYYMSKQTLASTGKGTWYFFGDNNVVEWAPLFSQYATPDAFIDKALNPYMSFSFGIGASATGVPFHTHGPVWAEIFHGYKRWWLRSPTTEQDTDRIEKTRRRRRQNDYADDDVYSRLANEEVATPRGGLDANSIDNVLFMQDPDGTSLRWMTHTLPLLLKEEQELKEAEEEEKKRSRQLEVAADEKKRKKSLNNNDKHKQQKGEEKEQQNNNTYRHDISEFKGRLLDCTLGPGELLYIPLNWHHSTLNIGDSVFMSSFI